MNKLILALITLALIACGDIDESTEQTCNVYDTNYSHTVTYCGLESDDDRHIVNVAVICDYRGQMDREDCDPADQLPELTDDCGHFNQCWRD